MKIGSRVKLSSLGLENREGDIKKSKGTVVGHTIGGKIPVLWEFNGKVWNECPEYITSSFESLNPQVIGLSENKNLLAG